MNDDQKQLEITQQLFVAIIAQKGALKNMDFKKIIEFCEEAAAAFVQNVV